ncbi:MAG: polysaccharide deacetylase family protein [Treponemataceae bacterium]|nr:polysaccharide deacetylase family protein [Treponemataceae bacterium]
MRHRVLSVFLWLFVTRGILFASTGEVIILTYHTFIGNGLSSLDFTKDELIHHLDLFEKMGFHFVSLNDAVEGKISGKKNLVFTIDDGNHSVPPIVRDVLLPRHIIPTLFISPGLTIRSQFCFRPSVVHTLYEKGCIIGAHGYTHQYLTHQAFVGAPRRSQEEIVKPGPLITQWIGIAPLYFAYPFGVASTEAKELLSKMGYRYAFTADTEVHPVHFDDPLLDPYAVPRTIIYRWNVKRVVSALKKIGASDIESSQGTPFVPPAAEPFDPSGKKAHGHPF